MKIYSVTQNKVNLMTKAERFKLKNGIEIDVVTLGESGRGRSLCIIPTPEDLTNVTVGTTKSGNIRLNTTSEESNDALILLKPTYGFRGGVEYDLGKNKPLTLGVIAQGMAGNMGGNQQFLLILQDKQSIQYRRTGRLYGEESSFVLYNEGGVVQQLPLSEFELLQYAQEENK